MEYNKCYALWAENSNNITITDGKLVLDGFEFVTTAEKILDIVGANEIVVNGENTIRTACNSTSNSNYGIYRKYVNIENSRCNDLVFLSKGAGIYASNGDATLKNSAIYIQMQHQKKNISESEEKRVDGISATKKVNCFNMTDPYFMHIVVYHNSDVNEPGYGISANEKVEVSNANVIINTLSANSIISGVQKDNISLDGSITAGKIKEQSTDIELTSSQGIDIGGILNAYLSFTGRLPSSTPDKTKVGTVTVTLDNYK